jgi:LacI family transcriptional regulator
MKDVAHRARVSVATVSHVLNGTRPVAPSTQERVLAAIDELGYERNMLARGLKMKRTHTLGLLVSDIQNPFFTAVVRGVEDTALARGYHLFLCNTAEDPQREDDYVRELRKKQVDGLLVASSAPRLEPAHEIRHLDLPVVFLDREVTGVEGDTIRVDNRKGMRLATEHLVGLGHTRVGMVSGPLDKTSGFERYQGLKEALSDLGAELDDALVRYGGFKLAGGREAAGELLEVSRPPTALVVANNLMTLGALLAIRERGWRIPEDLSVVGFDDMEWAALMNPPLTTIAQPAYEMGQRAVKMLFERMDDNRAQERIFLEPRCIVRESTGPPRKSP